MGNIGCVPFKESGSGLQTVIIRITSDQRNDQCRMRLFTMTTVILHVCLSKMAANMAGFLICLIVDEILEQTIDIELISSDDEGLILALLCQSKSRNRRIRVRNYYENIVHLYCPSDFRSHFRMSRTAVSLLEELLATCPNVPCEQTHGGRPPIDLRKQILITLWVLGNPECLRSIADRFDVTRSSTFRTYRRICKAISNNLAERFIKFPSSQRAVELMQRFEEKKGFPGVLGALDGCHIPIKAIFQRSTTDQDNFACMM